jgi:glycosyltransferase involved in cell wall biosynthesis
MRIGLVSYEYPPQAGLGGVGTYTFRLAGALGSAGHEVIVLAGPSEGREIRQPNVRVHRLPARYDPLLPGDGLGLRGIRFLYWNVFARLMERANPLVWHWLRWDMASGRALLALHEQWPLDVVEAPEHAANGLAVGRLGVWPMVVRIHGPWDFFFGINRTDGAALNRVLADLERRSVALAQVVTAPSRSMAGFMEKRWMLPERPLVVPNFMDVPDRAPALLPEGDQRIVCAGRLERFKGQDVLVRAFAELGRRQRRARLVLIGPDQWSRKGGFSDVVDQLAPDPEIRSRIDLRGALPLAETQAELRRAAVAVVPSTGYESFSFSTLEAMAAGRPTVVTRMGAMPELIDYGRCGLIVPPGDHLALAGAIQRLLEDRLLARQVARCAHTRAREMYDTSAVLPAFIETYQMARERFGWARMADAELEEYGPGHRELAGTAMSDG